MTIKKVINWVQRVFYSASVENCLQNIELDVNVIRYQFEKI